MRTLVHSAWTLAVASALAVAGLASDAAAGDAVKLSVELPKNLTSVESGDPGVEVQIVGIDAAGTRVGPGDRKVETSATEGELTLVTAPYVYRYMPPATVDKPTPVRLSAWLKQAPDVKGEASLTVMPRRPYEKLIIVAPTTSVELGKDMELEVRGVKSDGSTSRVSGEAIKLTADGVGTVESMTQAMYRFKAPAATELKLVGATAHLYASLERYPKVTGELSIVITGPAPPPGTGSTQPPSKPPTTTPPATPPTTTPPATPPAGDKDDADVGVLWPSSNVKLMVWRTRDSKTEDWSKKKHELPQAGKTLITKANYSRLRIEIERDDVRKIELEWFIGEKKSAPVHIDDADKEGRLRLETAKNGKRHAIVEFETPDRKPVILNLLLTTTKGEVIKEEFVAERGVDKDGDGSKDKKK